jgi:hypothetical protein
MPYSFLMEGDKIILQIVPPELEKKILDRFVGETLLRWKNLLLKKLEDLDISIWQMTDLPDRERCLDQSLFLPQIHAVVLFFEIKNLKILMEWLAEIMADNRLKHIKPIIVGCYQKGESVKSFQNLFEGKGGVFLWQTDDEAAIDGIYQEIINII